MPTSNLTALCLRRRESGESDWLLTLLTRESGKLAVVARGVRKPKARHTAFCQPGAMGRVQLATRAGGGGGMPVLAQVDLIGTLYELRQDLLRSATADYLLELADLALPDAEPHPETFDLLCAAFEDLRTCADSQAICHAVELRLMSELGYEPVLDRCVHCGQPLGDDEILFDPQSGGLVHRGEQARGGECVPVTPDAVRALRRLLRPEAYGLNLATITLPTPLARTLRQVLWSYVRCHLEVEPKSLGVLRQLDEMED